MDPNWATDHLQVIRTLMERSALYRRAMAPLMAYTGIIGLAAGLTGALIELSDARSFAVYWSAIAGVALAGSLVLVRRQALRDREPFWSPPARRVGQSMLPALVIGGLAGLLSILPARAGTSVSPGVFLPELWMCLYGAALCAAGCFMRRGIKVFGWVFIAAGMGCWGAGLAWPEVLSFASGNLLMAGAFGGLHLAYGIYLFFSEPGGNEL